MKITIISIGKFENSSHKQVFDDYLKRVRGVNIKEIELKNSKNIPIETLKNQEAELILKAISKNSIIISLDEKGQQFSSIEFSKLLDNYSLNGDSTVDFIIGGAFGLSPKILEKSHKIISFSKMTFPHLMVRTILLEQIYRAKSISAGHPYHKE